MKIAPNPDLTVEDPRPGSLQGRLQPPQGGERATAGKHAPEAQGAFSGRVIRVGVARAPSQRLDPRK